MSSITVSTTDLYSLFGLMLYVFIILFAAELLRRKEKISGSFSRKLVHIMVGNVVLVFPIGFTNRYTALIGPIFFILFTYLTCPASPIKKLRLKGVEEGHSFGTVYYAISLTILTAIFFYPDVHDQRNLILFASFLPLVWGDGLSGIIGKRDKKNIIVIFNSQRSILGSWIAVFSSTITVFLALIVYSTPPLVAFYISLLSGIVTAIVEAFSPKGTDNLTIPLVNAAVLYGLYSHLNYDFFTLSQSINWKSSVAAAVLAVILAVGGLKLNALTLDGAVAGLYFGLVILGLGSWTLGTIYGTFFVVGSLATLIGKKRKMNITREFEKGSTARDSVQATVNSIIPGLLTLVFVIFKYSLLVIAISAALATSLADTLGTEIGVFSKADPVLSIKPWKKAKKGYPGAVSLFGMLGTIIGAMIIAVMGWIISYFDVYVVLEDKILSYFVPTLVGGILGAYTDSILAVTVQQINKCQKCGTVTEKQTHCNLPTEYYKGLKWLKNDLVNLLAIISGSIIAVLLSFIITLC